MKFYLLLVLTLCGLPLIARAANPWLLPETFCSLAKRIQPKSERCEDNKIFTKSAELCLKRLRREVKNEGENVKKLFAKDFSDKQSQEYNSASFDQKKAAQRLAYLIQLTERVALRIDTYFDHVFFPIDSDMPEVNKGNFIKYILETPCYGDTVRALDSIQDDVVKVGRELLQAKNVAESLAAQLDVSEEKIEKLGDRAAGVREPASFGKTGFKRNKKHGYQACEKRKNKVNLHC